jgi:hypothetical protein
MSVTYSSKLYYYNINHISGDKVIFFVHKNLWVDKLKPRCVQRHLHYGDFGSHRVLKTESSNFVIMMQKSASISDDDTPSKMLWTLSGTIHIWRQHSPKIKKIRAVLWRQEVHFKLRILSSVPAALISTMSAHYTTNISCFISETLSLWIGDSSGNHCEFCTHKIKDLEVNLCEGCLQVRRLKQRFYLGMLFLYQFIWQSIYFNLT